MMTKRRLQITTSALIIGALVVIVIGLKGEQPVVWGAGLLFVAVAMVMSLATRWVGSGSE